MDETRQDVNLLSREDLYELVWQRPLSHVAPDLGLDGPRLANICKSRGIPYPPLGYWQKLAVGRAPAKAPLPPGADAVPAVSIPKRATPASAEARSAPRVPERTAPPELAIVPTSNEKDVDLDGLDSLHPAIKSWLREHRQEQQQRAAEIRQRKREAWGWSQDPISDLTERDLQRFRASSTLCHAVEKLGGTILGAKMKPGILSFRIDGTEIECKVVEKMTQSLGKADKDWTAFNDFLRAGLWSSGYLRVAITTWIAGKQPEWVESARTPIGELIPSVAARLHVAVGELREWERQRQEDRERRRLEEHERYERRRLQEIDDKRWAGFTELAHQWRERDLLIAFIREIERRVSDNPAVEVEGRAIPQWIEWARKRMDALDPFVEGVAGLFEEVASAGEGY